MTVVLDHQFRKYLLVLNFNMHIISGSFLGSVLSVYILPITSYADTMNFQKVQSSGITNTCSV